MSSEMWIAALSFIGTLIGTGGGIVVSAKLTNYRIEQLEKKVDKLDTSAEVIPVMREEIKEIERRLTELEKG